MNQFRKVLELLTAEERKQLYLLIPVVVVMALAEVGGIASIVPFLSLLANPQAAVENPLLAWFYNAFAFDSERTFLIAVGTIVLVAVLLSNGILAAGNWLLVHFGAMRSYTLSKRLLARYMQQDYVFFLTRNTSSLASNILQEVVQVVNGSIIPGLQAGAKAVATVAILVLLLVVDPWLALLTGALLGGGYGLIYLWSRRYLGRIGKWRVEANQKRHQITYEALGAIKEVKIAGRESEMVRRFAAPARTFARYQAASRVIASIPRYILEGVAFGSMLAAVLVMLSVGRPIENVLPLLGLYAVAGYRLLPALQQIFTGLAQIRYTAAALDTVHEMVERVGSGSAETDDEEEALPELDFRESLRLENVSYSYPGATAEVLTDIDLEIPIRSSVAFVGMTGAGKSTLVDVVLGLLQPQEGRLRVDGRVLDGPLLRSWQRKIGYVPQDIYLADDTVRRNIALGVPEEEIDDEAVKRAASLAQIAEVIERDLPDGYDSFIGEQGIRLSGGQRQRLGIARALYHDPEVLVLDEATSALDGVTEKQLFDAVSKLSSSKTIIMIAHRLSTVEACDQIFLMNQGRVEARGTYSELLANSGRFRGMAGSAMATSAPR